MSLEEQPSTLFHADILAPYQFASPSGQSQEPEARLMMAILGDGCALLLAEISPGARQAGPKDFRRRGLVARQRRLLAIFVCQYLRCSGHQPRVLAAQTDALERGADASSAEALAC